jgi:transcriptional regulator
MYVPESYKNENIAEVKEFLQANSFGILINQIDGKISGTHIPLELDQDENGKDVLVGHIAKRNPQSKNFKEDAEVLAIFNGPHSYISSSWYQKEDVPTWNYIAVHVYGTIKIIEGEELFEAMKKLVDKYEKNSKNPVSVEKMSSKTLQQINGVVGFSIKINEIQAAYKLSQKNEEADHENIINELENNGDSSGMRIAKEMRKING